MHTNYAHIMLVHTTQKKNVLRMHTREHRHVKKMHKFFFCTCVFFLYFFSLFFFADMDLTMEQVHAEIRRRNLGMINLEEYADIHDGAAALLFFKHTCEVRKELHCSTCGLVTFTRTDSWGHFLWHREQRATMAARALLNSQKLRDMKRKGAIHYTPEYYVLLAESKHVYAPQPTYTI